MNQYEKALQLHLENRGKIAVRCKVPLKTAEDLSLAYTPGVAQPCLKIHQNPDDAYLYTNKGNTVAVLTDGSAVLGLGNIGAKAALPVMEGKAALFREFAQIDAIPICLDTQDTDEIIRTALLLSPGFGGINLEDISAPRCFEIEKRLQQLLDIPVFHDDQHGTAIVVSAALIGAMQWLDRSLDQIHLVVNGAGAAGTAICEMLLLLGVKHLVVCDKNGILRADDKNLNPSMRALAKKTNPDGLSGSLADALEGADALIGVSAPGVVTPQMIRSMHPSPVVFAMANPEPEILPKDALSAGAAIVGTGRSDFYNQINNLLAFPGIFRGALDVRAKKITDSMKTAAALAIAQTQKANGIDALHIIPSAFDPMVVKNVAQAVANAWTEETA